MVKSRKLKGGHSPSPWTPGEYKGVGTIAVAGDANFAKMPNVFPSNQVGGRRKRSHSKRSKKQRGGMGYGFANPSASSYAAGSYFPITPTCTSALDVSRGGNNFMSGGALLLGGRRKRKGGALLLGGSRKKKGGALLLGGRTKKNKKSKKSKTFKWLQKGCNTKIGGAIIL
jgi:hypothetical protein